MQISFWRKMLYFLSIKGLNDNIDVNYNSKMRKVIALSYLIILTVIGFQTQYLFNINLFIRIFLAPLSFYIIVQFVYFLTIKKYNKGK